MGFKAADTARHDTRQLDSAVMAKNADDEPQAGGGKSRADQLRAAVEGAFSATASGAGPVQKRAQELADELVGAASRVRDALEELRPPSPDELDALRAQVEALERRVAELEAAAPAPAAKRKPRPKPSA
jgi:polyhydroxyalkanoate synthesis regulator phasin